jgi:hypothetical protein
MTYPVKNTLNLEAELKNSILYAAKKPEVERVETFIKHFAGTVIMAHDFPNTGETTLVHAEDLRVLYGTRFDAVGFVVDPANSTAEYPEPIIPTESNIGRLSVVSFTGTAEVPDYLQ